MDDLSVVAGQLTDQISYQSHTSSIHRCLILFSLPPTFPFPSVFFSVAPFKNHSRIWFTEPLAARLCVCACIYMYEIIAKKNLVLLALHVASTTAAAALFLFNDNDDFGVDVCARLFRVKTKLPVHAYALQMWMKINRWCVCEYGSTARERWLSYYDDLVCMHACVRVWVSVREAVKKLIYHRQCVSVCVRMDVMV